MLWLVWQLWQTQTVPRLTQGLDWIAALAAIGLMLSALFARFPHQAYWYAWPALGGLAAIYAVKAWCQTPERRQCLLVIQGCLSSGMIVVSLFLWVTQTFLPEMDRIRTLQAAGIQASYNFTTLELRNWAPFGHQNYVAGYLVLALPLLVGLGIAHQGRWRWWWLTSVGLGLVDLYTTSSRGGWIGCLIVVLYLGFTLFQRRGLNRRWLMGGSVMSIMILIGLGLANNRLRAQASHLLQGRAGGDMAYRIITHAAGWTMGNQNPLTGMGPGSVPLAYQGYRPTWAGLEAEQVYQLHGTLPQIWAELGLLGIIPFLGLLGWIIYQCCRQSYRLTSGAVTESLWVQSLLASLLGYSFVCLTDYQLDNVAISGFLVISLGVLAAILDNHQGSVSASSSDRHNRKRYLQRWVAGTLLGLIFAIGLWLTPAYGAWSLSSKGFAALNQQQFDRFRQHLGDAQAKAPWEPYYAYQLGWNLGDVGFKSQDPRLRRNLLQIATQHFMQGNQASPDQEFGRSNLAWLYMQLEPKKAMPEFVRAAELVPAKRGVFFGLGLSLMAQNQPDLALRAMTLECLRNPLWITSPAWQSPSLQPLYENLLTNLEQNYDQLMQAHPQLDEFNTYLHQGRGGLQWWRGQFKAAQADLDPYGSDLSRTLLRVADAKPGTPLDLPAGVSGAPQTLLQAWANPDQREHLLSNVWMASTSTPESMKLVQITLESMAKAQTFQQWLQKYPIVRKYHRQRAGFGVLSRHTDGPNPTDFFRVVDNVVMTEFFAEMMPTPRYSPALDQALQDRRNALLAEVKAL